MESSFPNISEYGLIGNCRTSALVSNQGAIEWCCFPHFDSPSFFAALLDRKRGGFFSLKPTEASQSHQAYLNDTNVLKTVFQGANGATCAVYDCFTVTTEEKKRNQLWPEHEILRVVEGVSGVISMRMIFSPRANFGLNKMRLKKRGKLGVAFTTSDELVILQMTHDGDQVKIVETESGPCAVSEFELHEGERLYFSLTYHNIAPAVIPPLGASAEARFQETIEYWRSWIGKCRYHGEYNDHVRRSALTLKLLTFAPSGAIIAAPTTSLPEKIGGVRNWDYRYCWLRDASFTIRALISLGFHEEASAFLSWMVYSTRQTRPKLQVLYTIYGEPNIPERELSSFTGYRDSKPVRVGNGAYDQLQLDIYGEVLNGIYQMAPTVKSFDRETQKFLIGLGRAVCEMYNERDDGIWEVRSGRRQHTHSKVMAWVALDRLIKLCEHYHWKAPLEEYRKVRASLCHLIEERGFNKEVGAYTQSFGTKTLDASLLVMPLMGYCSASSDRMLSTMRAISEKLSDDGLIYRYKDSEDGISDPGDEGAFGICSFWMVENLVYAGQCDAAREWFEAVLDKQNAVGLWPEEIEPTTGRFLGNYPQGFTHIGLINAALTLSQVAAGGKKIA